LERAVDIARCGIMADRFDRLAAHALFQHVVRTSPDPLLIA
jgi:hypothetical protein